MTRSEAGRLLVATAVALIAVAVASVAVAQDRKKADLPEGFERLLPRGRIAAITNPQFSRRSDRSQVLHISARRAFRRSRSRTETGDLWMERTCNQ